MSTEVVKRVFHLVRDEDVSGVSGTGPVAIGILWPSGKCSLEWLQGRHRSIGTYDSLEAVIEIHGHSGRTRLVWLEK